MKVQKFFFTIFLLLLFLIIICTLQGNAQSYSLTSSGQGNVSVVEGHDCGDGYVFQIKANDRWNMSGFKFKSPNGTTHPSNSNDNIEGASVMCWGDCFYSVDMRDQSKDYYLVIKDGTVSFTSTAPICTPPGPELKELHLSSDAFCGGSSTIEASVVIGNTNPDMMIRYTWSKNGVVLQSEETRTFEATSEGSYLCEVFIDGEKKGEESISIEASTPSITLTSNKLTLNNKVGSELDEALLTYHLDNSCETYPLTITMSNEEDFYMVDNSVIFTRNDIEGDYYNTVTVRCEELDLEESITLHGQILNYPACYTLLKENGDPFDLCTDENGDIIIDLDEPKNKFINSTLLTIPEGTIINCRNFLIKGSGQPSYSDNTGVVCNGTINCENEFRIKNLAYYTNAGNRPYFSTGCSSSIFAKDIYVGHIQTVPPFNGNWIADNMYVDNGQGQDLDFPVCSYVNTKLLSITANFSHGMLIKGHVVSEKIYSTRDIYLIYNGTAAENAILTIGEIEGAHGNIKIIAEQYTIVNLCSNPTVGDGTYENVGQWNEKPKGADNLGYYNGYILYNYGDGGWPEVVSGNSWGPEEEWDINYKTTDGNFSHYKVIESIPAYASYEDCMEEKVTSIFLGYEDDPFYPKDKEIKGLYNCNICSDEYKDYTIKIDNTTYRLVNGQLIYCENDN